MEEVAAGGIVWRDGEVLLIRDAYGRWTFPKGHVEAGESPSLCAVREVAEETGVQAEIVGAPAIVRYTVPGRGNEKIVYFFPMRAYGGTPLAKAGEVQELRFCAAAEAEHLLRTEGYEGYSRLLTLDGGGAKA